MRDISVRAAAYAIGLVMVATAASAQSATSPATESVITTTGQGIVRVAPDRAWITVGVESRAKTAREAQQKNTDVMKPVLDKLRGAGVPSDAIKTIGYDLQYEWDYVNNKRVGRGYVARNTVEIRVDDVMRVAELLEIAGSSGATNLGGVRFDLKDESKVEREALRLAVADARGKAEAIAAAAGRSLDRIIRIEEQGGSTPIPIRSFARAALEASAKDAAPPISAGEMEVRGSVTLTIAMKP